jgi:hypothetical protein
MISINLGLVWFILTQRDSTQQSLNYTLHFYTFL